MFAQQQCPSTFPPSQGDAAVKFQLSFDVASSELFCPVLSGALERVRRTFVSLFFLSFSVSFLTGFLRHHHLLFSLSVSLHFEKKKKAMSVVPIILTADTNIIITKVAPASTATTVDVECVLSADCAKAVENLFQKIQSGNIQLGYYLLFGVDPRQRTVRNPTPALTFPLWAIGVIIGGVAAIGILILLLCCLCSRGKGGRRKRKPQKMTNDYVELSDDAEKGQSTAVSSMESSASAEQSSDGSAASSAAVAAAEDKEVPFEVLFSIKKPANPDGLVVNRKEVVYVMQSAWDTRGEFVSARSANGSVGKIPSTHLKRKNA